MPRSVLLLYLGVVFGMPRGTSSVSLPPPEIAIDRESQSVRIRCTAPSTYLEGTFFLYREGQSTPVEELLAPESRHSVTFAVPRAPRPARYWCYYSAWSSGQRMTSEVSSLLTLDMMVSLPPPEIAIDGESQSVRIRCTAPSTYPEVIFFLYREGQSTPVKELHAPESRHSVTFAVPRAPRPARYWCCYSAWSSGQRMTSEESSLLTLDMMEYTLRPPPATQDNVTVKDAVPAWIVPVSVGGAIALLLVIALVAVVAVKCVRAARKRKQREKDTCWTQNTDISKTNLAFRGSMFEDSMPSYEPGISCPQNPTDHLEPNKKERMQLPSSSHFSTFRT